MCRHTFDLISQIVWSCEVDMAGAPPPPDKDSLLAKRYRGQELHRPANPHMAQQANYTIMKSIRIELRAADCHLFLTSDPAWVGAGNIYYEAFQLANKYAMKSKFLTLNTKYLRQPGQSAQEAAKAGHLNALYLN